jgi:hypothetical protein
MDTADTRQQPPLPPRPPHDDADADTTGAVDTAADADTTAAADTSTPADTAEDAPDGTPPPPAEPPKPPVPPVSPGGGARPTVRRVLLGLLAVAVVAVLVVVLTGRGDGGPPESYTFPVAGKGAVVLDGVSGRVHVTADPGARDVTARFQRADGRPALVNAVAIENATTGADMITLTCEEHGSQVPCTGDLALVLPEHTALRLGQTSGETVLTGLGGDLDVTASSVRLTADGLRSAHARFAVTSGSADLSLAAAPRDFTLTETSASVRVDLPRSPDGYAVTTAAASASTQVDVPDDPASTHRISLTVTSGSLSLAAAG